jgi:hypothetical protein
MKMYDKGVSEIEGSWLVELAPNWFKRSNANEIHQLEESPAGTRISFYLSVYVFKKSLSLTCKHNALIF